MHYILFFGFYFIFQFGFNTEGRSFNVSLDELGVGKTKNYLLNESVIYIIEIRNLSNVIERVPPRIFIKCEDCNKNHPLLVVVSLNKGVLSWELPIVIESNNYLGVYKNIERTLCPYDIINTTSSFSQYNVSNQSIIHPVTLALSTSSSVNKNVELSVNLEEEFELHLDENKTVELSPSTPAFYLFEFLPENNVTSVLLEVQSEDDICLIVSVQNVSCPVFDLEENIGYRGHFQTVTRQGGFTLTKEAFPNGFYVVLVVSGEDNYCSSKVLYSPADRNKTININLSKIISMNDYKIPIYSTILVILVFCSIMFIIFFCSIKRETKEEPCLDNDCTDELEAVASGSSLHLTKSAATPNTTAPASPITPNADSLSIKSDSSLDETDYDFANDAEFDKNIFRMKNLLYLCDLARKNQRVIKKKSDLYFRNLITVSIFYFLPVIQLVFADQYLFNQSGREDLCYYNFLCSHPLWWFSDFNHIFSNIGYVVFGVLFMISTALKERVYEARMCSNKKLYKFYGIPQHFGLFYAMGAALIIEGIMSSCYHVCPNHYNFQFDTSFMYVICTLCMIKIYQARHPDINANAYATFSLLAVVIFIGMYGVFSSSLSFWIFFTFVHFLTCIYLSLQIYYMGRWKWNSTVVLRWFKDVITCQCWNLKFFSPMFPSRFVLLSLANFCNWGLIVGSFVYKIQNFSSYLLAIFMVNLLLYTSFYILMKFVCREKLPMQSAIYILLSLLCWVTALYFFFSKTVSWTLSPAESKLYNQKCKLLNFYDNHDIWHFISAAAMFFSFMVLLTFDDDLIYVHRSKIVVF